MNNSKNYKIGWAMIFALTLMLIPVTGVQAQDSQEEIAERMKARTEQLNAMKDNQVIGENWEGTLTKLSPIASLENARLVDQENEDRKALFAILAEKLQVTPERVAERFRKRSYLLAKPDHFIQNAEKKWILKKNATTG